MCPLSLGLARGRLIFSRNFLSWNSPFKAGTTVIRRGVNGLSPVDLFLTSRVPILLEFTRTQSVSIPSGDLTSQDSMGYKFQQFLLPSVFFSFLPQDFSCTNSIGHQRSHCRWKINKLPWTYSSSPTARAARPNILRSGPASFPTFSTPCGSLKTLCKSTRKVSDVFTFWEAPPKFPLW